MWCDGKHQNSSQMDLRVGIQLEKFVQQMCGGADYCYTFPEIVDYSLMDWGSPATILRKRIVPRYVL